MDLNWLLLLALAVLAVWLYWRNKNQRRGPRERWERFGDRLRGDDRPRDDNDR